MGDPVAIEGPLYSLIQGPSKARLRWSKASRNSVQRAIKRHVATPEQSIMDYLEKHDEITNRVASDWHSFREFDEKGFYRLRDSGLLTQVPNRSQAKKAWHKAPTGGSNNGTKNLAAWGPLRNSGGPAEASPTAPRWPVHSQGDA